MKEKKTKFMCLSGVLTALVFVFTAWLHIPSYTGYTHVGDAFIYLSACILPLPYGVAVGAGGAFLADCLTGYAIWAPGSVLIKALSVLLFSSKSKKILSTRNLFALLPAATLGIGGYYLYDVLITGNFVGPVAGIPGYVTQAVLSSALFVILGMIGDRIGLRKL